MAQYQYSLRASTLKEPEVQHQPLPMAGRRCGGELANGLSLQFNATLKVASLGCKAVRGVWGRAKGVARSPADNSNCPFQPATRNLQEQPTAVPLPPNTMPI